MAESLKATAEEFKQAAEAAKADLERQLEETLELRRELSNAHKAKKEAEKEAEAAREAKANLAEELQKEFADRAVLQSDLSGVAEIRQKLERREKLLNSLQGDLDRAEGSRKTLMCQLETVTIARDKMEAEMKAFQADAEAKIAAAIERGDALEAWRADRERWEAETKKNFLQLEKEHDENLDALAKARKEAKDAEAKLASTREAVAEVEERFAAVDAKLAAFEASAAEEKKDDDEADADAIATSEALEAARREMTLASEERVAAEKALEEAKSEISFLKAAIDADRKTSGDAAADSEETLARTLSEASRLREEVETIRASLIETTDALRDAKEREVAAKAAEIRSLTDQLDESEADATLMRKRLETEHDAVVAALKAEHEAEVADLRAQLEESEAALDGVRSALAAMNAELNDATEALAAAKNDLASTADEILEGKATEISALAAELAAKDDAFDDAKRAVLAIEAERDIIQRKLEERDAALAVVKAELEEAYEKLAAAGADAAKDDDVKYAEEVLARELRAKHEKQAIAMERKIAELEETMVRAHVAARDNAAQMLRHNQRMGRVVDAKKSAASTTDADIPVKFEILVDTLPGQRVAMVGTWNDWNLANAFPMRWSEGGLWTITTPIHADDTYEYKYVVVDDNSADPEETAVWQHGNNRTLALHASLHDEVVLVEVCDSWVPDPMQSPILLHSLDGSVQEVGSTKLLRDCVNELRTEQALIDGSEYYRVLEEISSLTKESVSNAVSLIADVPAAVDDDLDDFESQIAQAAKLEEELRENIAAEAQNAQRSSEVADAAAAILAADASAAAATAYAKESFVPEPARPPARERVENRPKMTPAEKDDEPPESVFSIELSGEENDSDATEEQMGEEQRNNVLPANAKVVAEKEATRERIEKEKEKDETKMKILADGTVVEDHGEDDDLEIGGSMKTQDVGPR